MSRSRSHDLADLRNHLYGRAEWLWQGSLVLSGIVLALTLWGFWSNTPSWLSITGLAAIISPVMVAWMREAASELVVRGDKCRRLILYSDGFGHEIASSELAEARAWGLGVNPNAAPFVRPYYSSREAPGARRLADILTESAFFTKQLAARVRAGLTGGQKGFGGRRDGKTIEVGYSTHQHDRGLRFRFHHRSHFYNFLYIQLGIGKILRLSKISTFLPPLANLESALDNTCTRVTPA